MKLSLHSPMGNAVITQPKLTSWNILNLFKAFVAGMITGTTDKRFATKIHDRFGLNLLFGQDKTKVYFKSKPIDVTRPFYNLNSKRMTIFYELWIWTNGKGFHKLVANEVAPNQLVEKLDYKPEFIVVLSHGHNERGKWATINCQPWPEQVSVKPTANRDWHLMLAQQLQARA